MTGFNRKLYKNDLVNAIIDENFAERFLVSFSGHMLAFVERLAASCDTLIPYILLRGQQSPRIRVPDDWNRELS